MASDLALITDLERRKGRLFVRKVYQSAIAARSLLYKDTLQASIIAHSCDGSLQWSGYKSSRVKKRLRAYFKNKRKERSSNGPLPS